MKIVVLGGGTVGGSIAELLCQRRHDVTVLDSNPARTKELDERLDARLVTGMASQSSVLFQAGVMDADLALAVTGNDEVNLVAASLCKAMGARRTLARIYAAVFRDLSTFDYQRHFEIDRLLSLEHLSAIELARGIGQSGSAVIERLTRGGVEVRELVVSNKTASVGVPLKQLQLPRGVRIGSILRGGHLSIAGADDHLEFGDRVTLIGASEEIVEVQESLLREAPPKQNVVIAGGGETGYHLAEILQNTGFHVVIMELDRERCEYLAEHLLEVTIVNSDCNAREHLEEERVGSSDVFVSCTGDDEANIMAAVEAKELGAKKIMAVVGRPDYANVVGKLGIDHAVSPREVMAKQVLSYLHTGPVVSRSPLFGGGIEILELDVVEGSPATHRTLRELSLPEQTLIAAVIREGFVHVPGADDHLRGGDTVVALIENPFFESTVRLFSSDEQES